MRSAFVLIWSDNSQDYYFASHLFSILLPWYVNVASFIYPVHRRLSDQWPWQHGSLKLHSDRMILSIEWGLACNVTIWTSSRHKLCGTSPFSSLQSKTFTFLQPNLQTRKFYFLLCSLSTQPFNQNAFNFFAFLQHNKEGKVILKTVELK